jgi:peptidoglycan/LPS O-acetylase OafA/YrhL
MDYRPDIQILRGVAVLLVVLFHLGAIPGGFLGVDVFFVISGYLMARLYDPADKVGFLVRRAKRLLPAYFVVVLTTLIASVFLTDVGDFAQVSNQTTFAALFASNIGFWAENSYFDKSVFKPLLHLWSLGVELQFYLCVPVLAWLFGKRRFALMALLIASGIACFTMVGVSPKTAFFLLPFRLWEFLAGFGIALCAPTKEPRRGFLGIVALATVVILPFVPFDARAVGFLHGHPGLGAVTICTATAAVIAFGLPRRAERIGRPLGIIGDYSYSIYLIHFPVIALMLYEPFSGTVLEARAWWQFGTMGLITTGFVLVLYYGVERPFQRGHREHIWKGTVATVLCVLLAAPLALLVKRICTSPTELLIYDALADRDVYRCGKLARVLRPTSASCQLVALPNPTHRILLVGDSHADAIKKTFAKAAQELNDDVYFLVQNDPLIGGLSPMQVVSEAERLRVGTIVLHYSPGSIQSSPIVELAHLAASRSISVSLILPVPVWDRSVPAALIGHQLLSQDVGDYRRANRALFLAMAHAPLSLYDPTTVLCSPHCVTIAASGRPLYFDSSHLTLTGSALLRPVFESLLSGMDAIQVISPSQSRTSWLPLQSPRDRR